MKIATDWAELKARVKWLHTAFGLGQMVAEWEGHDGVRHKVKARTSLELLGVVRSEIDSSEREPPKVEETALERQQRERRERYIAYEQAMRGPAIYGRLGQPQPVLPTKPKEQKPKTPDNPYKRKFG